MVLLGGAPERNDGRMLDEEEHVLVDRPADSRPSGRALKLERGGIRERTEVDDEELATHAWIIFPSESSAASAIASDSVGCAWMARSTSSTVYSFVRATTSSWINSVAWAPTMCAPRISPYFAPRMIFAKPSVSPDVRARPLAEKGNLPTL